MTIGGRPEMAARAALADAAAAGGMVIVSYCRAMTYLVSSALDWLGPSGFGSQVPLAW